MALPDAALGISSNFNAQEFRDGIHFAMQMGAPVDDSRKAVFVFASTGRSYSKNGSPVDASNVRLDQSGQPIDPEIKVVEIPGKRVTVDCAVEISKADSDEMPVGNFRDTKATVTLLDVDYEQVKGCKELEFNGDRYAYGYEPDGLALFDVAVNTIIFYALEER